MNSYTYTIGSAFRTSFMVSLDELGIPYTEHRNFLKSVIVVKTYTIAQEDAYYEFELDFAHFMRQLEARQENRREEKRQAELEEIAKKLARKNRFRRLTFRKPLASLPR